MHVHKLYTTDAAWVWSMDCICPHGGGWGSNSIDSIKVRNHDSERFKIYTARFALLRDLRLALSLVKFQWKSHFGVYDFIFHGHGFWYRIQISLLTEGSLASASSWWLQLIIGVIRGDKTVSGHPSCHISHKSAIWFILRHYLIEIVRKNRCSLSQPTVSRTVRTYSPSEPRGRFREMQ